MRKVVEEDFEPDSDEEHELANLVKLKADNPNMLDARLRKVFEIIDSDKSGLLDLQEFKVAAKKFDLREDDDIKTTFERVDIDQSGMLDFEEFRTAITLSLKNKHLMAGIGRNMRKKLRTGDVLNLHMMDEDPEKVHVKVNQQGLFMYEEKEIGWSEVALADVNSITADACSKVFKTELNKGIDANLCFSVHYSDPIELGMTTLDFSAETSKKRDNWVRALRKLNMFYKNAVQSLNVGRKISLVNVGN